MMISTKIAVIGGTGLYNIPGVEKMDSYNISTPFGDPTSTIHVLDIDSVPVAFLSRHGEGHRVNPTFVNSRANIFALKVLGVETIISVSAVGSLKEDIHPTDIVIPDQIIDRTKSRVNSFFEPFAVHVGFAEPFCNRLAEKLFEVGCELNFKVHHGGVYVCMEGPLFSTKAESALHRSWGASIIGMTALPEAKLAREAEICYATLALVTDYDVWKADEEVEIEKVIANINSTANNIKKLIFNAIPSISEFHDCSCHSALKTAFVTDISHIPEETQKLWAPLISKYF